MRSRFFLLCVLGSVGSLMLLAALQSAGVDRAAPVLATPLALLDRGGR